MRKYKLHIQMLVRRPEPRDQNVCVRGSRFITFRLRNELDESVIAAKCIASSGEVLFEGAR